MPRMRRKQRYINERGDKCFIHFLPISELSLFETLYFKSFLRLYFGAISFLRVLVPR